MAGKITRLNDPANPYGGKATKLTAERSAADAAKMRARPQVDTGYSHKAPNPMPGRAKNIVERANEKYGGGARVRALDAAIDKASK
jgi:hypothetical protein